MASTAVSIEPNAVITMTMAGGFRARAFSRISRPCARVLSRYKSVMISSGDWEATAETAAGPLVKGKTSCPSLRSSSLTVCTMVSSSCANKTFAIVATVLFQLRQAESRSTHRRATVGCTLLLPRGTNPKNKPGNHLSRLGKICGLEPVELPPRIDDFAHLENRQEHT